MLARAALAAVLVPLGIVCLVSLGEVRKCGRWGTTSSASTSRML